METLHATKEPQVREIFEKFNQLGVEEKGQFLKKIGSRDKWGKNGIEIQSIQTPREHTGQNGIRNGMDGKSKSETYRSNESKSLGRESDEYDV